MIFLRLKVLQTKTPFSVSENILVDTKTQGMKNNNVQLFRKDYFHAVFYGFHLLLHIAG